MTCWASQAADDHAATVDQAEAREAYVALFHDDAADASLREGGAADLIYHQSTGKLESLLLAVLDADKDNAYSRACALRDALRAEAWDKYAPSLKVDAERLADGRIEESRWDAAESRMCEVPAFPSIRGAA
jgi:hypothetical protein